MSSSVHWVPLIELASGLEVDLVRAALEADDIPVLVRGNHVGIYGSAFQGAVLGGATVLVPSPELARAQAILAEIEGEDGT